MIENKIGCQPSWDKKKKHRNLIDVCVIMCN
jgi:hypothetical protein